jgi:hypothetical protein
MTKKTVKEQRKMTSSTIDYKVLNSSTCSKNALKYFFGDDYIIDCMTPYKIYRYVFKVTSKSDPTKIQQLKREIESNTKKFMSLIEKITTSYDKNDKNINSIRDEARKLDEIIYIQKYNLSNIEKGNSTTIADKPYQMFIIPRNQNERSFIPTPEKKEDEPEMQEKRDIISGKVDEMEDDQEEVAVIEQGDKSYADETTFEEELIPTDTKEELTIENANKKSKKMLPSPRRISAPKKSPKKKGGYKMRAGGITEDFINNFNPSELIF